MVSLTWDARDGVQMVMLQEQPEVAAWQKGRGRGRGFNQTFMLDNDAHWCSPVCALVLNISNLLSLDNMALSFKEELLHTKADVNVITFASDQ